MHEPKIYWLVSYPKSGNTWCRIFLLNYVFDNAEPIDINNLGDVPPVSARFFIDQFWGIDSSELTNDEIVDLRKEALLKMNKDIENIKIIKVHDSFPLEKDHNFFSEDITAGVIYIVRNPFDVVVSFANHLNESIDKVVNYIADDNFCLDSFENKISNQFPQKLLSWSGHVKSWSERFKGRIYIITYEDLYKKTEETFTKLIRFLNVDFDEVKLKRAIELSSFSLINQQEINYGFKEKSPKTKEFFREGKIGTWKKHLTELQKEKIINDHYEVMLKLNYFTENGEVLV